MNVWECGFAVREVGVQHGWKTLVFRCPLHWHCTNLCMKRLRAKHRSSGGEWALCLDHLPLCRAPSPHCSADLPSSLPFSLTPHSLPGGVGPWQSPQPSAGRGDLPATLSAPRGGWKRCHPC